jgi:hypothetical protein
MSAPVAGEHAVPAQIFRRRIVLSATDRRIDAALEDDVHHFYAEVDHDGEAVTAVRSRSVRTPRTNCDGAAVPLRGFEGLALLAEDVPLDPRKQCTHLYELVRLAIGAALRGGQRQYDLAVPLWSGADSSGQLRVDGAMTFDWTLRDQVVTTPGPFEGLDLKGRVAWPEALDADTLEAAKVLRRGIWIGAIRSKSILRVEPLEFTRHIRDLEARQRGVCFAHQPGVQEHGKSNEKANIFDFTGRPDDLLADLAR